jgi:hypothetical protein
MADEPSRSERLASYYKKEWLTRKECAEFLTLLGCKISAGTLSNLAANNNARKGPAFHRTRWSRVAYKTLDVEAWAKTQTVRIA